MGCSLLQGICLVRKDGDHDNFVGLFFTSRDLFYLKRWRSVQFLFPGSKVADLGHSRSGTVQNHHRKVCKMYIAYSDYTISASWPSSCKYHVFFLYSHNELSANSLQLLPWGSRNHCCLRRNQPGFCTVSSFISIIVCMI